MLSSSLGIASMSYAIMPVDKECVECVREIERRITSHEVKG